MAKKKGARLSDFQFADAPAATVEDVPEAARRFDLGRFDPGAKPFSSGSKAADLATIDGLASDIDRLQDLLYADRRFKLLVVLQGTDTSGKDGTIRGVFSKTSALGVRTAAWKAPSEEERAHDFLWRIHQKVPAAGEIVIFNRSHYEDVLVPPVKGWITRDETERRYAQINDFERLLTETGTTDPQVPAAHLEGRAAAAAAGPPRRPDQALEVRGRRPRGAHPLGRLPGRVRRRRAATGTSWAPWTIVPADSKTHRNLMIENGREADAAGPEAPPIRRAIRPSPASRSTLSVMTELAADYQALAAYRPAHQVRFVTAAALFDGHDAAINIMRRIMQAGRRGDPPRPQPLGRRDRHGGAPGGRAGHRDHLLPGRPRRVLQVHDRPAQRAAASSIKVFGGGGGMIVPAEIEELHAYGVARLYSPEDGRAWAWRA